ncbi:DUF3857 domain-containing protein [Mucilaginibacter sp.]|uniref:DUF3857 domain-containing protein n=1 Tax=Mucilaginibacter sp. TaxID=1882438 RepID=UPI000CC6D1A6|nr:DUF3857 domain-containing protein [Mucilaginibacter sp.]PLW91163.1 MAG: hypothetical protein C0154_02675 [Mucilaginibacter sp.]HEK19055.1 DUF3857 domain-containing protein [Bacteroidota bacterium]
MKKPLLLLTLILTFYVSAHAQTYDQKASDIQKLVWDNPSAEFSAKNIPAKYNNESAVILAKAYSMQRTSSLKFKFLIITAGVANRVNKIATYHERVKINDKVALEKYSTLEYQKKFDNSLNFGIAKIRNIHETYVGAKIIKANGQEIVVNTNEAVLTKNTSKDQQGKLAIPGLQVGDILDYYISTEDSSENGGLDSFKDNDQVFVLANEYPVLSYSLYFQFNKKSSVFTISANGAPDFQRTTNKDGDEIYSLAVKDLPKYKGEMWSSPFRQLPYVEITNSSKSKFYAEYVDKGSRSAGLDANKELLRTHFNNYILDNEPQKMLKEYFDGKKGLKAAPLDSSMQVFYNIFKYRIFGSYNKGDVDDMSAINYRTAQSNMAIIDVSRLLTEMKIPHQILLVASRESNSLQNVLNFNDFGSIIKIENGNKPLYMSFYDAVTHFNEIPAKYQGEQALSITTIKKNSSNYVFEENSATIPVAKANENMVDEQLQVSLSTDMQKLKVQRLVKQTGYIRHSSQRALLSAMDIDKALMDDVKGDPLEKRISKTFEVKKYKDALISGMAKSANDTRNDFLEEAKGQYDQEPSQLSDFKVINAAINSTKPVFEYTSTVVLNNLVKKAGNNFIIDAGKLCGSFVQIKDDERQRTVDVYMPAARTFKYTVAINIPQGYAVKGMEEFNKQKVNKTGSFSSNAVLKGNVLTIVATRSYTNNFEKAADWPLITEVTDAGFAFNNHKILLEKL